MPQVDPKKSNDFKLWLGRLGLLSVLCVEYQQEAAALTDTLLLLCKGALQSSSGPVRSTDAPGGVGSAAARRQ